MMIADLMIFNKSLLCYQKEAFIKYDIPNQDILLYVHILSIVVLILVERILLFK